MHALILLAVPRSGSTLTYQVLAHGLECSYLSNLGNLLYQLPLLGGLLSRRQCADHGSEFHSEGGFVPGLCGPAEGLRYWSYWLDCGLDERIAAPRTSDDAMRSSYLHAALSLLATPRRPVVTGYLGHALMVERLQCVFPDAAFIRLHRDPVANALSILRCRRQTGADWFSVFPRECLEDLGTGIHREVASQVYWLNRRMAAVEQDRTIHVRYEDLCRQPDAELERVIDFCATRGFELARGRPLPERFDVRAPSANDEEDAARVTLEMERLESQFGPA